MDILTDKKLVIGSLISIALVFGVFLIAGYIHLPFIQFASLDRGDNLGCLNMLPAPECYSGKNIMYLGKPAVGFSLKAGTEIYAPFSGVFFEDETLYEDEEFKIMADTFVRARFGVVNTPTFVVFTGEHAPALKNGETATEGATVAVIAESETLIHEESNSNFVVYGEEYDLTSLFK